MHQESLPVLKKYAKSGAGYVYCLEVKTKYHSS